MPTITPDDRDRAIAALCEVDLDDEHDGDYAPEDWNPRAEKVDLLLASLGITVEGGE